MNQLSHYRPDRPAGAGGARKAPGRTPPAQDASAPARRGNARGERTRRAMLGSARQVFLERGFDGASILEICRRGAFSNATFYRHFRTKDEVFQALAHDLSERLAGAIERDIALGGTEADVLERAAGTVLELFRSDLAFLQIFRETELVAPRAARAFYGRIERAFEGAVPAGAAPGTGALLAHLVLGAVYFNCVRSLIWDRRPLTARALRSIAAFVRSGMAARPGFRERAGVAARVESAVREALTRIAGESAGSEAVSRGEVTRRKILAAALDLFGAGGIASTKIGDVATRAGIALGTVYVHFESKESLVAAVVREVGERLRAVVAAACAGCTERRELESRAFRAFLAFARESSGIYRIVRDAEFAVPSAARSYYTDLADAYARRLEEAMGRGEVRELDPMALAYALMGFGHFVGLRLVAASAGSARKAASPDARLVEQAIRLELYGAESLEGGRSEVGTKK